MSKNLIAVMVCIMAICNVNAQSNWYVGTTTGFNATGIQNQNPYENEKLPVSTTRGTSFGLLMGYSLNNKVSLSVEPQYSNAGQNYIDILNEENSNTRNIELNYVQIPVLMNYVLGDKRVKFNVQVGPQIGLLTSSLIEESFIGPDGGRLAGNTDQDRFNKSEISGVFSTGALISIAKKIQLRANVKTTTGFSDINKTTYKYEDSFANEYKASKNFSTGINFGIVYAL